jgi:hypothetical protein
VAREGRSATAADGVMRKDRNEATRQPEPLAETLRLDPGTRAADEPDFEVKPPREPRPGGLVLEKSTRIVYWSRAAVNEVI